MNIPHVDFLCSFRCVRGKDFNSFSTFVNLLTVESESSFLILCCPTHTLLVLMSVYRLFTLIHFSHLREGCSEHGRFGISVVPLDSSSSSYVAVQPLQP